MRIRSVPKNLTDFLVWFKEKTETTWQDYKTATFEDFQEAGVGGGDWLKETKWISGFTNEQIDSFEQDWKVKFPPDYRFFLEILGTVDRPMFSVRWAEDGHIMIQGQEPSFYNWQTDKEAIKNALALPLEGILFDVENNAIWLDSWGSRPDSVEERKELLSNIIQQAPPLIPIIGHRYLLGTPLTAGNPVLSIHQSDIIIYGSNLRNFLILELSDLLGINPSYHNRTYQALTKDAYIKGVRSIPFWGELIA